MILTPNKFPMGRLRDKHVTAFKKEKRRDMGENGKTAFRKRIRRGY